MWAQADDWAHAGNTPPPHAGSTMSEGGVVCVTCGPTRCLHIQSQRGVRGSVYMIQIQLSLFVWPSEPTLTPSIHWETSSVMHWMSLWWIFYKLSIHFTAESEWTVGMIYDFKYDVKRRIYCVFSWQILGFTVYFSNVNWIPQNSAQV